MRNNDENLIFRFKIFTTLFLPYCNFSTTLQLCVFRLWINDDINNLGSGWVQVALLDILWHLKEQVCCKAATNWYCDVKFRVNSRQLQFAQWICPMVTSKLKVLQY